jgi:hypothetical protein
MASLTGYTQTCALQSGGVKKLHLAIVADVASFTFATPDYSAATMVNTKVFKEYQFELDSFELKEDVTIENKCKKIVHSIVFFLAKLSSTLRAAVDEIATNSDCGLIAIAEDNNGNKWVLGYSENFLKVRPLYLKSGAGTTGKKLTDANGVTLTLEAEDNELMRLFTGTVPIT